MRRVALVAICLAFSLSLTPAIQAAAQSVDTDMLPGVNFSQYKTYSWVEGGPPAGMNPVQYQRIIANFDAALAAKGYQKAEPGDLSLVMTVGAREKTNVQSWGRFGLQTYVYQYTEGQLSLDVYDTNTKQALWHGQATKAVNPRKVKASTVEKAVNKMMKKFPATGAAASAY